MSHKISASLLKDRIAAVASGCELAILDVREEGVYAEGHLLFASTCPLSRLELLAPSLVPRRDVAVVVMDGGAGEDLAERAATRLAALSWSDVAVLENGLAGWRESGFEVFGGMNVPSKAFGELVELRLGTPHVTAHQLRIMMDRGDDLVVLDSRPMDEFRMMNIPGALDCPVSELVYRVHDLAPDADRTVVVNCAGRTRSILGAQSLINAGVPNRVVALEDGTMGWHLAGYELERNQSRMAPAPSPEALQIAAGRAARIAERAGVCEVEYAELEQWRADTGRTTYVFDVRLPEEYEAGHLAGSRHAIGVQLTQKTDAFMATLGARVVVVDDDGVRARLAAAWLRQMGWDAPVLAGGFSAGPTASGPDRGEVAGLDGATRESVAPRMLAVSQMRGRVHLLDLSRSLTFARGHIPGARFAIRSRFAESLSRLAPGDIVLTCEDGTLSRLAAPEVAALGRNVKVLAGGNAAWRREKLPWETGRGDPLDELEDEAFWRPYERASGQEEAMHRYLSWEKGLIGQIEGDGDARFEVIDCSAV